MVLKKSGRRGPYLLKTDTEVVAAMVLLGGPVDPKVGRGRYIVAATSKDQALRFVSQDPAVAAQLFSVDVKTWKPFQSRDREKQGSRR